MYKQKIADFFEYVVILFFILDTNTVYSTTVDVDFHIPEIAAVLFILCVALRLFSTKIKESTFKQFFSFILIYYAMTLLVFIMSVSEKYVQGYVARFLILFPILILYFYYYAENGKIFSPICKYVNIMTVLAAISVFFWVFASQLHIIKPTGGLLSSWGSTRGMIYPSYFGLYFECQKDKFLWYNGYRNQGIFAEGPMHSLCLVLAIASELFLPKEKASNRFYFSLGKYKKSYSINWKLVCLIAALITTFTTTGQILLILMLVFLFFMNRPKTQFDFVVKLLLRLILTSVGAYAAVSIFLLKSESLSWKIRVDDFTAGFRAWLSSPIWGIGYADIVALIPFRASFRTKSSGFSNSITLVLAEGGIIFLLIYLIPLCRSIQKMLVYKNTGVLMWITILMFEFIFTVCAHQLVILFFFAFLYGLSISVPTESYLLKNNNIK